MATTSKTSEILGAEAAALFTHKAKVDKKLLHLPGPDFVDRIWMGSDRNPQVLRNLQSFYDHGRLAGTGYMSILPVDQVKNEHETERHGHHHFRQDVVEITENGF